MRACDLQRVGRRPAPARVGHRPGGRLLGRRLLGRRGRPRAPIRQAPRGTAPPAPGFDLGRRRRRLRGRRSRRPRASAATGAARRPAPAARPRPRRPPTKAAPRARSASGVSTKAAFVLAGGVVGLSRSFLPRMRACSFAAAASVSSPASGSASAASGAGDGSSGDGSSGDRLGAGSATVFAGGAVGFNRSFRPLIRACNFAAAKSVSSLSMPGVMPQEKAATNCSAVSMPRNARPAQARTPSSK